MSLEVSYKNRKIADLEGDADCTLKTAGKFCEGDISLALREAGAEPSGTVSITRNGTVNVRDYASAEVNVPNSYTAADEGKVVKNGALVAQTARATEITANGTYDTTENNSVTVNVSGGGGGIEIFLNEHEYKTTSSGTFSYSKEIEIQTNGSYFVSLISYSSRPTISINGVPQSLSFEFAADHIFYYTETIILQLGDIISFSVLGNGKCAAFAQVIKLL